MTDSITTVPVHIGLPPGRLDHVLPGIAKASPALRGPGREALVVTALVPGLLDGPAGRMRPAPPAPVVRSCTRLALSAQTGGLCGGYLNGASFQQSGLLSFNGYQYAAYWDAEARVVLARRPQGHGPWMRIHVASGCRGRAADVHTAISMGASPRDGRLHLAFDHYDGELRHLQSVPGLLTHPGAAGWQAGSFGPVCKRLGPQLVQGVAYPRFVATPDGGLLLSCRRGTTGQGDEVLWLYDGQDGTWAELGAYIGGAGSGVSPYLHGLEYHGRRLHAAWCWRSTPDPSTNQDLLHAWSDDDGRSWRNDAGALVGRTGVVPMGRQHELRVWSIGPNRGLVNQEHMIVDRAGHVHVLLSHLPDGAPDEAGFMQARERSRWFHYWRDLRGRWSRVPLQIAAQGARRGKLAVSAAGNLYAVLPGLRIASASAAARWADWTLLHTVLDGQHACDPLLDRQQLRGSDRLTVFAPAVTSGGVGRIDTLELDLR